ncbi:Pentatricopeptide repeat-containing protein [Quillaja saponaria]|uniref:Pentatricopeptide repeat-containing protein n=1 Tax=Quillaja saponaria TaxID=32244 RepID=A0AAD7PDH3_QUISA|nr:Pentatricopeptide repeat-containing protein [Quillaja saponaria]
MLRNALETNVNLLTKFITVCASLSFYDSPSVVHHARRVFDHRLDKDDVFLCNSMIKAHVGMHQFAEYFNLYTDLRRGTGFIPDEYTFTALAKCCSLDVAVLEGEEIHTHAAKTGFCSNLYVSTSLVDMYAKFGKMGYARKLFDEMWKEVKYHGRLYRWMQDKNVISWTSMIYGYCNNGDIESARSLFDAMTEKNLFSCNAMIGGYSQNKKPQEVLKLFHEMLSTTSFEPDKVTILSILPAITDLGALDLVDGYTNSSKGRSLIKKLKCEVTKAKKLFDVMSKRETATWNALINGFAINGCAKEALEMFSLMQQKRPKPNEITVIGVLSACNHCGLVDEGRRWFKTMEEFGLTLQIEHYGCMVDLLGRAGSLEEAEKLIKSMPYDVNEIILSSFLFACGNFKDVNRAEKVLKEAGRREQWNDGNYVMLRNLYATEQRWTDVENVKQLTGNSGANKEVGCSVIEVDGKFREFVAGNNLHLHLDAIQLA